MKVVILTNPDHVHFVSEIANKHSSSFQIEYWKVVDYPLNYDIGISFMYQHKVPAREVNTHTWFNFHPAPLPEYKGRNLCYHAIMNGEMEFGATIHYMDENFDTGNIIWVDRFKILPSDTAEDVSRQAIQMSKVQFNRYFPRILAGEKFSSSPNAGGTYYEKIPIQDTMIVGSSISNWIRAVTYKEFYPKLDINGVLYKIVKE